ncbi:myosin light chain kinase family member 4 isoform X2 [Ascaphus truei]|uniref:myosin light chain kinase family member 4 isoform X2 n=1 Tax=Ascaphus truei TaxID=8439 RepID=UPI003F5911B7
MGGRQKEHIKYPEQDNGEMESPKCAAITDERLENSQSPNESGDIKSHICMSLKMKRIETINTCYNSEMIGEMSCSHFQEVQSIRCVWEEKSSESDGETENEEVTTDHKTKQEKEKPYLDFNGTTSPKKKPPDSERSVQTIQFCAHKEKVQKLNQENTEKTTVIVVEGGAPEVQLEANCDIERCISIDIPISHSKTSVQGGTPIIFPTEAVVDRETAAQNEETIQSPTEESAEAEDAEECLHKIQEYKEDTKCVTVEGEDEQKIVCVVNSENEKGVEQDANKQEVKGDEEQIVESETAKEETKSILVIEEEELVISEDQDQTVGYTETSQDISKCPEIEGQLHVTCTDPSQSEKDTQALPEEVKEIPADLSQNGEICHHEQSWGSKRRGTDEDHVKDDSKKSRVDTQATEENVTAGDAEETSLAIPIEEPQTSDSTEDGDEQPPLIQEDTRIVLDVTPPPPAPFDHRIVSAKHAQINSFYTVEKTQVVGRGRFGQVHRCIEKTSGLTLAAKIIKVKIHKEKEEVKNEIQVMNQLNHVNLIQLYDAFESRNDIVLVMEYVDGGELFDRIIDENSNLSEVDTILFIKQICEGIQYMHQMYIIHLDLKPENIMCVSRAANQIKIIDFGLARRYKPREKLKVHFGTPEFLAPEVVNYDFVSFPTDMWSVGVIAYMLLSGLSPFLGENDNETLNNILACQWDFEGEEFQHVSEDAKEFIIKLLVKDKGWRMCATEALKHSWLSDSELHHRISQQRKKESCPVPQAPVGQ